jgi:hypothetical protein
MSCSWRLFLFDLPLTLMEATLKMQLAYKAQVCFLPGLSSDYILCDNQLYSAIIPVAIL